MCGRKGVAVAITETIQERCSRIRLVIFDVDGVLTNGCLYYGAENTEIKAFHVRDGQGIKLLRQAGLACAVISGRSSQATERRLQELGVEHIHHGIENKLDTFQTLLRTLQLSTQEVAHVGDDLPDLPIMTRVGLAVAVADADEFVKQHAHWITDKPGGRGAAREVCERILETQGLLQPLRDQWLTRL